MGRRYGNYEVFARRFDAAGGALAGEFQVNTFTFANQFYSAIAGGPNGFVVVWTSTGQDGDGYGVFGKLYDSAGNAVNSEFQANTYTTDEQLDPDVAMDSTGFVVVWRGGSGFNYSVFGRRYDLTGAPAGGPFVVSTQTTATLRNPAVALDGAGSFVATWDGQFDGDGQGVVARRYDVSGNPQATEFQVNLFTATNQAVPRISRNATGFVIVWLGPGIRGRRFNPDATLASGEFVPNAFSIAGPKVPSVALGAGGDFVVTWESDDQDSSFQGIFARRFDANGAPTTGDVQVNSYVTAAQARPDIARVGSRFVVVWNSRAQDGSGYGVFGQRFRTQEFTLDVDGNGSITPLTDTLLLLRYAFGFRGATLINAAVGAGCTRCTAPAIEDYLAGEL